MYRGGPGMLAWALHRITGVAVLLFLLLHIVETSILYFWPRSTRFFRQMFWAGAVAYVGLIVPVGVVMMRRLFVP